MLRKILLWLGFMLLWLATVYLLLETGHEEMVEPIFVVGFVVFIVYLIVGEVRKTRGLKQAAAALGFEPLDTNRPFDDELIKQTKLWTLGTVRFKNVFRATRQDATVTIGNGYIVSFVGSSELGIAAFEYHDLEFPVFRVIPELVTTRFDALLHIRKIEFATCPEFSRKYRVQGEDEFAIRQVLNTDVVALLSEKNPMGPWAVAAVGRWLFLGHVLGGLTARDLPGIVEDASRLASELHRAAHNACHLAVQ